MFTISKFISSEQMPLPITDPDLELVRRFALKKDLASEQIWTGRQKLCNDGYDRTRERFPVEYLERIAATAPGKAVLGGHDTRSLPLARYYDARVTKDEQTGQNYVSADYYVNLGTQRGRDLVSDIEAGVLKDVSVTIKPGPRLCDLCGKSSVNSTMGIIPGCEHWPGMEYDGKEATATYCPKGADRVEMYEGSFVYCGAQYGAEASAKGLWVPEHSVSTSSSVGIGAGVRFIPYYDTGSEPAGSIPIHIPAPKAMGGAMFDSLEKALAEIDRLQGLPLAAEREAELSKQIAELRPLSESARKAIDWQMSEIRRMADIVNRKASYDLLLSKLNNPTWEDLEPTRLELAAEVSEKLGPATPQGSTDGPHDDEPPAPTKKKRLRGGYF